MEFIVLQPRRAAGPWGCGCRHLVIWACCLTLSALPPVEPVRGLQAVPQKEAGATFLSGLPSPPEPQSSAGLHLRFCLYQVLDSLGSLAFFKVEVGKENRSISKTSVQASGTQTVRRESRDLTEVSTHWPLETLGLVEAKGHALAQAK